MIITQELESQQDISADVIFPPSDLYSDEPPVETELHLRQIILLFILLPNTPSLFLYTLLPFKVQTYIEMSALPSIRSPMTGPPRILSTFASNASCASSPCSVSDTICSNAMFQTLPTKYPLGLHRCGLGDLC